MRPHTGRGHAVELVLDEAGEQAVRALWAALEAGGIRSLARHTGATHRPHLTVLSGPRPAEEALRLAARALGGLLPVDLASCGPGLLVGPRRHTVVELVAPPPALLEARSRLAELWPDADPRPWLPHLTLASRLSPEAATTAVSLLSAARGAPVPGVPAARAGRRRAVGVRWWDPDQERAVLLVES